MSWFRLPVFALALLAMGLTGCFSTSMGYFRSNGLPHAATDLTCPADQLTLTPLNDEAKAGMDTVMGALVGVTGCGKQVVYLLDENLAWVMNTAPTN